MMTAAFRSFFRYLFQTGELRADFAASVPTVADRRLSTVTKHLSSDEVERVLNAHNHRAAIGRRDYAILLLLGSLGLRSGEVARLRFEDINWNAGEILVRDKGSFHDRMPLPRDVGKALLEEVFRRSVEESWNTTLGTDAHTLSRTERCEQIEARKDSRI